MVLFNHTTRELTAKIVYYGPGLSGKTTNLRSLHERLDQSSTGRLLSLATSQDRTIYFDLLPVELGNIKGYGVRFQLCTVPGQVFYNETRKLVLKGVDGIVFVVDSQWSMLSHNLESFQNLKDNLREMGLVPDSIPTVIQFNKRDLPGILSVEALQESLGFRQLPFVEAVAPEGRGVVETFKLVSKLTFIDLMRKLQKPTSLAVPRSESSWIRRGKTPPAPAATEPARAPVEETAPTAPTALTALTAPGSAGPPGPPSESTPESPFEMAGDLPSLSTDEIFGIPLHVPEAPSPEELLAPEAPPAGEFQPAGASPAGVNEFEYDLAAQDDEDAPEGSPETPAPEEPVPSPGPAEAAPAPDPGEAAPPEAEAVSTDAVEGPETLAPEVSGASEATGPPEEALPAREEAAPVEALAPGPIPDGYAVLERRVAELEGKLERVLSALRGALVEPGGRADAPAVSSGQDPEEPGA